MQETRHKVARTNHKAAEQFMSQTDLQRNLGPNCKLVIT